MAGTNGHKVLKGLDAARIAELRKGRRARNVYGPRLVDFMESDEAGVIPAETWPLDFEGKNASSIYQSFRKAAKDLDILDDLDIGQNDGTVFILHKERAAALD